VIPWRGLPPYIFRMPWVSSSPSYLQPAGDVIHPSSIILQPAQLPSPHPRSSIPVFVVSLPYIPHLSLAEDAPIYQPWRRWPLRNPIYPSRLQPPIRSVTSTCQANHLLADPFQLFLVTRKLHRQEAEERDASDASRNPASKSKMSEPKRHLSSCRVILIEVRKGRKSDTFGLWW